MANMSYCRFENTKNDLTDCMNAIGSREHVSDDEARHMKQMIVSFVDFLNDEFLLNGDGTLDEEILDDIIQEMKQED